MSAAPIAYEYTGLPCQHPDYERENSWIVDPPVTPGVCSLVNRRPYVAPGVTPSINHMYVSIYLYFSNHNPSSF